MVPDVVSSSVNALTLSNAVVVCPANFSLTVAQDVTITAGGGLDVSNSAVSIGRDLIVNSDGRGSAFFRGGPLQQVSIGTNLCLSRGWFEVSGQAAANPVCSVGGDFTLTNGASWRELASCSARASNSLPVPVLPLTSTVQSLAATRRALSISAAINGLR